MIGMLTVLRGSTSWLRSWGKGTSPRILCIRHPAMSIEWKEEVARRYGAGVTMLEPPIHVCLGSMSMEIYGAAA
jgi:hypothetical protein